MESESPRLSPPEEPVQQWRTSVQQELMHAQFTMLGPDRVMRQNIYAPFTVEPFSRVELVEAFSCLADRHKVLRSELHFDSEPGAAIASAGPEVRVLSARPVATLADAELLIVDDTREPHEIGQSVCHLAIVPFNGDSALACLVLHHLVGDALSLRIALGELAAFYDAALSRKEPDLPPLRANYGDYAIAQHEVVHDFVQDPSARLVWRRVCDRLERDFVERPGPALLPPGDREISVPYGPPSSDRYLNGLAEDAVGIAARVIEPPLRQALVSYCNEHGGTEAHFVAAAIQYAMWSWNSETDPFFLFITEDRFPVRFEGLIGLFADGIPMWPHLSSDLDWRTLVRRNQGQVRDHVSAGIPFAATLNVLPRIAEVLLTSDFCTYQFFPPAKLVSGSSTLLNLHRFSKKVVNAGSSIQSLRWMVREEAGQLLLELHYDGERWSSASMDVLVSRAIAAMHSGVRSPTVRLGSI